MVLQFLETTSLDLFSYPYYSLTHMKLSLSLHLVTWDGVHFRFGLGLRNWAVWCLSACCRKRHFRAGVSDLHVPLHSASQRDVFAHMALWCITCLVTVVSLCVSVCECVKDNMQYFPSCCNCGHILLGFATWFAWNKGRLHSHHFCSRYKIISVCD